MYNVHYRERGRERGICVFIKLPSYWWIGLIGAVCLSSLLAIVWNFGFIVLEIRERAMWLGGRDSWRRIRQARWTLATKPERTELVIFSPEFPQPRDRPEMSFLIYLHKGEFQPEDPQILDSHLKPDTQLTFVDFIPSITKRSATSIISGTEIEYHPFKWVLQALSFLANLILFHLCLAFDPCPKLCL